MAHEASSPRSAQQHYGVSSPAMPGAGLHPSAAAAAAFGGGYGAAGGAQQAQQMHYMAAGGVGMVPVGMVPQQMVAAQWAPYMQQVGALWVGLQREGGCG